MQFSLELTLSPGFGLVYPELQVKGISGHRRFRLFIQHPRRQSRTCPIRKRLSRWPEYPLPQIQGFRVPPPKLSKASNCRFVVFIGSYRSDFHVFLRLYGFGIYGPYVLLVAKPFEPDLLTIIPYCHDKPHGTETKIDSVFLNGTCPWKIVDHLKLLRSPGNDSPSRFV
jgi:hypothetical protein